MNSKEKNIMIAIISVFIISFSLAIVCWYIYLNKSTAYATNNEDNTIKISNAKLVDIEKIISDNTYKTSKEEIIKEETELEYITKYRNNNELLKGTTQVSQEGRNGIQQIIKKRTYDEQGNIINEEQLGATVVKSSINKVIDIGTAEKKQIENKIQQSAKAERTKL